jgi:ligand-binding SRPBCC domain-containing protein
VIVNVCPAAVSKAPPERIWSVLSDPKRVHEWNDATFVSAHPPGVMTAGQVINLTAPGFGGNWPVRFDVRDVDPQKRWLDVVVRLPLGIVNHERITLTDTPEGGTLVRFN